MLTEDYIHTILASLHWLPVPFRIDFKTLLITFKARLGLAPSYITEMLTPYEPVRSFRSSGGALLAVPKSRLKSKVTVLLPSGPLGFGMTCLRR